MGLRFNRRVKLMPGVTLNFSKSGVSTSFGTRGLRYTVGHGKRRFTVGAPGTGLSYTTVQNARRQRTQKPAALPTDAAHEPASINITILLAVVAVIALLVTSPILFISAIGIVSIVLFLYMLANMVGGKSKSMPACPHCTQQITDGTPASCPTCQQRITWINGKGYRPSRPAE